MRNVKKMWSCVAQVLLMLVAIVVCDGSVLLAAAPTGSDLAGGGVEVKNDNGQTRSAVEPNTDPSFYSEDVDQKIAKVKPQGTPVDAVVREVAKKRRVGSMEVSVYSLGSRVIMTTMAEDIAEQTSGQVAVINPTDSKVFTYGDQIAVEDVTGYEEDGVTQSDKSLVLLVVGQDASGKPSVVALNGKKDSEGGQTWLPLIPSGSKLVRMGKACAESDAQVPAFAVAPTKRTNYCQNYMFQIKQSIIDKMSDKEVPFTLSDVEEAAVYDMKRTQELSRLFSVKKVIYHPTKNEQMYNTEGLWWQAANDYKLEKQENGSIMAEQMVDLMKKINTGMGAGSKRKVMIAGSDLVAVLTKMELDKVRVLKQDVKRAWEVEFTSFSAFSGTLLVVHSELFDAVGREDQGLIFDPEEVTQGIFMPFTRTPLDLKGSGQSNSEAYVFQQIDCLYISNRYTATRVKLL